MTARFFSYHKTRFNNKKLLLTAGFIIVSLIGFAQKKYAFVTGKVIDEQENYLPRVSVTQLGNQSGITTNDTGYFRIRVPAERAFALVFTYTGHRQEQKNFLLNENEEEFVIIRLVGIRRLMM